MNSLTSHTHFENDTVYQAREDVVFSYEDTTSFDDAKYAAAMESSGRSVHMDVAIYLKDKKNITLDFQGHRLFLKGRMQPFLFDHCENVVVKNVVVEHDRAFCTEFLVLESTPEVLRGRLNPLTPCFDEDGKLVPYGPSWENHELNRAPIFLQSFDAATYRGDGLWLIVLGNHPDMDMRLPWCSCTAQLIAKVNGDEVSFTGPKLPLLRVGTIGAIGHENRKYSSLQAVDCHSLTIQNYQIKNGAGMGLLLFHCQDVTIQGLVMAHDEKTKMATTNVADGIHAVSCSGDFVLSNSIIEGTMDDILNIHTNFYAFEEGTGKTIRVCCPGAVAKQYTIFNPGDKFVLHRGTTLEEKGTFIIEKMSRLGPQEWEFVLDTPCENGEKGDLLENLTCQPHVQITNCRFANANTHLRFQSRGGIEIEHCVTELPFWLTGDTNYWYEGSPVETMKLHDVRFETGFANIAVIPEFTPTPLKPYYHGKIEVTQCVFETDTPLQAHQTASICFQENQNSLAKPMRMVIRDCGEVTAEGISVEKEGQ